jgi:hypothetical protein
MEHGHTALPFKRAADERLQADWAACCLSGSSCKKHTQPKPRVRKGLRSCKLCCDSSLLPGIMQRPLCPRTAPAHRGGGGHVATGDRALLAARQAACRTRGRQAAAGVVSAALHCQGSLHAWTTQLGAEGQVATRRDGAQRRQACTTHSPCSGSPWRLQRWQDETRVSAWRNVNGVSWGGPPLLVPPGKPQLVPLR